MAYTDKLKQKEASRRHYLKNKQKVINASAKWKENNPEKAKEHAKKSYYIESDIEGVSKGAFNKRKWRDENQDQNKIINKKWREENKEKISAYNKKYYIKKNP